VLVVYDNTKNGKLRQKNFCAQARNDKRVTDKGIVRRKCMLSKGAKGTYSLWYLFDSDGNSMRIAAFKGAAVNWYDKLYNEKYYRISKVSVRQNISNNVPNRIADCIRSRDSNWRNCRKVTNWDRFSALGISQKLSKRHSCRCHRENSEKEITNSTPKKQKSHARLINEVNAIISQFSRILWWKCTGNDGRQVHIVNARLFFFSNTYV